jgi:hypothetical protein
MPWYEWADTTLALPRPSVLVHADLHGDNQVWTHDKLRLVVDFETASAAEPEYLRTALGDALWRSEAGIPLSDHRTPAAWIDDLSTRFQELGIDPGTPPATSQRH